MLASSVSKSTISAMAFVVALSTAIPQVALAQDADAAADEQASEPGVIIVTARKREESLLETPISISALTSEDIEKRGITSINDVVNNTPGINVSNVNSGRSDRSFQQISLRGMTPSTAQSTLTATFIDGVPVSSASALNSITDPARIEVLKGPQNAYFGRNAFAGAVNIVTKAPSDVLAGQFSAMGGTRNNYDVSATIEGPIVPEILTFRLTGRTYGKDGSYFNRADPSEQLGSQRTSTATAQFQFTPSSALTIKAFGMVTENDDGPSAQGMLSAYELRANNGRVNIPFLSRSNAGTVVVPSLANCTLNGLSAGILATEPRVARPFICGAAPKLSSAFSPAQNTTSDKLLAGILGNTAFRNFNADSSTDGYGLKSRFYHLHLNLDYDITDSLTFSTLTGYNNERYSQLADLDNYDGSLFANTLATAANGLRTFWTFPFLVERRNTDFSQEARFTFENGGPLHAMLGASYLLTKTEGGLLSVFNEEQFPGAVRSAGTITSPGKARTIGVFGNLTYDITDALSLNLEGRWQRDTVYAAVGGRPLTIRPAAAAQYGLPAGTFAPLEEFFQKDFDNFMPRVIVNYKITPDTMIYASWSKAANVTLSSFNTNFLSGTPGEIAAAESIGLGVIVEPEKFTNYELGLKGKLFDNRVQYSLAAYAGEWTDQHNLRSVIFLDTTQPNALPSIVSGVVNSGRTLVKGIELDVTAQPVDGISINASAAFNDSNIRSFGDPSISKLTGIIGDGFRGNQLPLTSKYSANIGLQYTGQIEAWDNGSWFVRADTSYKSKQFVDAGNLTWIRSRTQVNARMGITREGYTLEAFVSNLFNNKRYVSAAQNNLLEPSFALSGSAFGYLNVGLPELRVFGVKGTYRF